MNKFWRAAPVLIRALPYKFTQLGNYLIGHYRQMCLLEESLERQIAGSHVKPHIAIALNRDSLETWFLDLIEHKSIFENVILEVIADDQELTMEYLKNGRVSACLSTSEKTLMGNQTVFLGNMEYVLAASPEFKQKYFSKGDPIKSLLSAPAIKFDQNDKLHKRYLEKFFGLNGDDLNYHVIPSVRGFKKFALLGYGYCLIPKIDVAQELKKKTLVQLFSDKIWSVPLYWHYWAIESPFYRKFNAEIIHCLQSELKPFH